jgi:hypothetical protein
MTLARATFFSVLLLRSIGAAQSADPGPTEAPPDGLEAARRELRELPSLDRNHTVTPAGRSTESAIQLPLPAPAAPAKGDDEGVAAKTSEPSQGWLLDAFKQTESKERSNTAQPAHSLSPDATRRKREGAPNPFGNFLQQWLSPQDRRLLGGEKLNQTSLERAGIREEVPFRPKTIDASKTLMPAAGEHRALGEDRVNPYLAIESGDERLPSGAFAAPSNTAPLKPPPSRLSNFMGEEPTYSPNGDTAPALSGATKRESLPPPTAPLFDERRYFPQLRRF